VTPALLHATPLLKPTIDCLVSHQCAHFCCAINL
jgi:hypothetical protein